MKKEREQPTAKLIDRLVADPGDGKLLGCLATTYEMTPDFLETDFIPTLLGIGAWDDRAWSSRILMEKRLAELDGAAILTAAEPYRGRPRSLRLEVKPMSRRGGGSLHAKVFVAVYEECVRLIVASANLTEQGYRENREVALVLTASKERDADASLIATALRDMTTLFGDSLSQTAREVVQLALGHLGGWGSVDRSDRWLLWSGGPRALWEQFTERWPAGEAIARIVVVSPFWSEEEGHLPPVGTLVDALKARAGLLKNATLTLMTEAAPDAQTTYKPTLPESFNLFDARGLGVSASAVAVDPISHENKGAVRRLHAKVVLIEGESTSLIYAGSGNFTRRGWGFMREPSAANIEAGIVIRQTGPGRAALASLVPKSTGTPVTLDGAATGKLVRPLESSFEAPWPTFIEDVRLVTQTGRPSELALEIVAGEASGQWSMFHRSETGSQGPIANGGPHSGEQRVDLSKAQLEQVLRDQEVRVSWLEWPEGRPVPVNVDAAARLELPIMPGSGALQEGDLISYYQGRISWEDLFPDPDDGNGLHPETSPQWADARAGVDTSRIQSYIVREFVEALKGIADDVKAAAQSTKASMRLAILGAVSPVALARRITESAMSAERSVTAAAFQLVEIQVVLKRAEGFKVSAALQADWSSLLRSAQEQVRGMLDEIKAKYPSALPTAFQRYEKTVLRKAVTN